MDTLTATSKSYVFTVVRFFFQIANDLVVRVIYTQCSNITRSRYARSAKNTDLLTRIYRGVHGVHRSNGLRATGSSIINSRNGHKSNGIRIDHKGVFLKKMFYLSAV